MKKLLVLFGFVIMFQVPAKAGFLIEPYLAYTMSGSADFAPGMSVSGMEIGGRLGFDYLGLGYGVDMLLSGKYTYTQSPITIDSTPTTYGLFISYKFPILVRGYLSYMLNLQNKTSVVGDYYTGNATKIGIQYTGLPFVALGVEMFNANYDKYNLGGVESSVSQKESHTNIVLSVPFSL